MPAGERAESRSAPSQNGEEPTRRSGCATPNAGAPTETGDHATKELADRTNDASHGTEHGHRGERTRRGSLPRHAAARLEHPEPHPDREEAGRVPGRPRRTPRRAGIECRCISRNTTPAWAGTPLRPMNTVRHGVRTQKNARDPARIRERTGRIGIGTRRFGIRTRRIDHLLPGSGHETTMTVPRTSTATTHGALVAVMRTRPLLPDVCFPRARITPPRLIGPA